MKTMTKKQRDIILAACREFEEYGFAGTGMEQIAAAADVSKRTLYKHYSSKEAVFSAILDYLHQERDAQEWPEYDPGSPLRGQLEAVIRCMLGHLNLEEHIRLARIVISEAVRKPELGDILARTVDFSDNAPSQWIRAAMDDGRLKGGDPAKAAFYLAGLVRAHSLWPRLVFCAAPLSGREMADAASECADFFLGYYDVS
ncbi:TetR/AcrR family transcriptional regulator [Salidesulfovibrio onnuriiensis]|uniref:TetR/AcrR family transcriptional regulator n=1 Tax=Salidesulfovibrio onnuriiensis TaxID=2583823 RepID=UPI00164EE7ED|nr:TetR/AcrR family transcriptional regulator [Salidesulfovibrio onnuriiensis]